MRVYKKLLSVEVSKKYLLFAAYDKTNNFDLSSAIITKLLIHIFKVNGVIRLGMNASLAFFAVEMRPKTLGVP